MLVTVAMREVQQLVADARHSLIRRDVREAHRQLGDPRIGRHAQPQHGGGSAGRISQSHSTESPFHSNRSNSSGSRENVPARNFPRTLPRKSAALSSSFMAGAAPPAVSYAPEACAA